MHILKIEEGGHNWEKQNLMTITSIKGSYDIMSNDIMKTFNRSIEFIKW